MPFTVLKYGEKTIPEIRRHLAGGHPVVLPNPSPLPYMVVGTSQAAINLAKRRPLQQSVASFVSGIEPFESYLDLNADGLKRARYCLMTMRLTVLCPIRPDHELPAHLSPSLRDGYLLLFAAHLPELRELCDDFSELYVSSGNLTEMRPEQRCSEVREQFEREGGSGLELLFLDGDHLRNDKILHGSTTMVRISRSGQCTVVREGIQEVTDDFSVYIESGRT